jgi:hypothetical protein
MTQETASAADRLQAYERLTEIMTHPYAFTDRRLFRDISVAIPDLIAMVREKDASVAKLVDELVWYEERNTGFVTQAEILKARAMAAEERVKELEKTLDTIVRGRYDGLEVTHYSANECRNIARAALRR